jgi:putative restriction endonuclease
VALTDVTRDSVLAAIVEYDDLGQTAFLAKYHFQRARKYVLLHDGKTYDSKALIGVAHRYATGQILPATDFSGGERTVVTRLTTLGFDVRDSTALPATGGTIGEIPGVPEGQTFNSRQEAHDHGVHRALQSGIVGKEQTGAESIVVSGGYEDDIDNGWEIIYTGHGGRENGRQVADQKFEASGNAALLTSKLTRAPVRVIRGAHRGSVHAPATGYRYDGLYLVQDAWRERGRSGYLVCRYRLVAVDAAIGDVLTQGAGIPPATDPKADPTAAPTSAAPIGNSEPGRAATTTQRLVRSAEVAQYVKTLHDHTCQTCGTQLDIRGRGYSEGAHIRALGQPHAGPDVPQNVLCLCPNCHVLFDNGALLIGQDMTVLINGIAKGSLRIHPSHDVDRAQLEYHRSVHQ